MVEEVPFPAEIRPTRSSLSLLGYGVAEIPGITQPKLAAMGVYLGPEMVGYLRQWKGKTGKELADDDRFFQALISAPGQKLVRVVVITDIEEPQYGVESISLVEEDEYKDEEEAALNTLSEFFQSENLKKDSVLTLHFQPSPAPRLKIRLSTAGKEDLTTQVEDAKVVRAIQKWYLGGSRGVSPETISSLAYTLAAKLSEYDPLSRSASSYDC